MHPAATVTNALELAQAGLSATEIAKRLGLHQRTVSLWLKGATPRTVRRPSCERCGGPEHSYETLPSVYAYLLGLYLGDGCISTHLRDVYRLRIVLDVKYPEIIDAAVAAMRAVRGGTTARQLRPQNCVEVSSYWRSWPCLFPQHGPGRKHARAITLTDWQQRLVERFPDQLLRGLIHSDGCRFQNTGTNWSWPRYAFDNRSADIRNIFCRACEQMVLRWTASGRYRIYVSRKADVAILDAFIGPKR